MLGLNMIYTGGKPLGGKKLFSTDHILCNNFEPLNISWWKRYQKILYYGSSSYKIKSLNFLEIFHQVIFPLDILLSFGRQKHQ